MTSENSVGIGYRFHTRQKTYSIGPYGNGKDGTFSLSDARRERDKGQGPAQGRQRPEHREAVRQAQAGGRPAFRAMGRREAREEEDMERYAPLIPRVQVCLVEDAKLLSRVRFSQWLRVVCAIPRNHPRVVSEFMGSFASCATSTDSELGQPSHLRNSKAQHSVHDSAASRNGFSDRHFTQPGWLLLMLCSPDYRPQLPHRCDPFNPRFWISR
jgi:hypothetical protein